MKRTSIRLLMACALSVAAAGAFAQGSSPLPGDHTPIVHDRTPSTHDHGTVSTPHK
jgi:hypothetical protein